MQGTRLPTQELNSGTRLLFNFCEKFTQYLIIGMVEQKHIRQTADAPELLRQ